MIAFLPSADSVGQVAIRVLAVAGAAFLGGLLVGFLTNVLAKALTAKALPRPALIFLRLLGAAVAGVLAAMLLFHSGIGDGWGWGGGGGPGPGKGTGGEQVKHEKDKETDAVKPPVQNGEPIDQKKVLRIEVLSRPDERRYRVEGGQLLLTREEVGKLLDERRKGTPALEKVVVVLYKNSPDQDTSVVKDLVRTVELKELAPDILLAPGYAP